MTNKEQINKIKDNAELAWAAYGYFDRIKSTEQDRQKIVEHNNKEKELGKKLDKKLDKLAKTLRYLGVLEEPITLADILNMDYQYYRDEKTGKATNDEFLSGDFTPNQAKRFFEKYDLLIHQPNTESGFSACLFQNKESKEFILAIRGTEEGSRKDLAADVSLIFSKPPKSQYEDMLLFYQQCTGKAHFYEYAENKPNNNTKSPEYELWKKLYERNEDAKYKAYINEKLLKDPTKEATPDNFIPPIDEDTKLIVTGHSLGGALAQLFVLSFAKYYDEDGGVIVDSEIINEVYTFNSPGSKKLDPGFMDIICFKNRDRHEQKQNIASILTEAQKQYGEGNIDKIAIRRAYQEFLKEYKGSCEYAGVSMGQKKTTSAGGGVEHIEHYYYPIFTPIPNIYR